MPSSSCSLATGSNAERLLIAVEWEFAKKPGLLQGQKKGRKVEIATIHENS